MTQHIYRSGRYACPKQEGEKGCGVDHLSQAVQAPAVVEVVRGGQIEQECILRVSALARHQGLLKRTPVQQHIAGH